MSISTIGGRFDVSPAPNKTLQFIQNYITGGAGNLRSGLEAKFNKVFGNAAGSFLNSFRPGQQGQGNAPSISANVRDGSLKFALNQTDFRQLSRTSSGFIASQYSATQASYRQEGGIGNFRVSGGIGNFKGPEFALNTRNATTNLQYSNSISAQLVKNGNNLTYTYSNITKIALETKGGNVSVKA